MKAPPRAAAVCVAAIISQQHPNVLPLKREIDLHVLPAVTASLNVMTERKLERIVIDLSSATYIDSAGLAALILAMQKIKGFGGRFFLAGLDKTMRSIFDTSGLDQIFQIFPDIDAALAAI
jgi:anti-sigma B factor antagonist